MNTLYVMYYLVSKKGAIDTLLEVLTVAKERFEEKNLVRNNSAAIHEVRLFVCSFSTQVNFIGIGRAANMFKGATHYTL